MASTNTDLDVINHSLPRVPSTPLAPKLQAGRRQVLRSSPLHNAAHHPIASVHADGGMGECQFQAVCTCECSWVAGRTVCAHEVELVLEQRRRLVHGAVHNNHRL